jgi:hypothetical protein
MRNPGLKARLLERLDIIGLLAFSITVLFIAFPNLLFSQHVEEIPRAAIYYRYFVAAAFIILLVLASIFLFLPRRVALVAASMLGAYALLVLIFDLIHPLSIGLIQEGTEVEPAAPVAGAIQIVLMVGAFFALFYIPRKARGVLAWSLAAVFLVSGLPFLFAPTHTGHIPEHSFVEENETMPDFNIYHILFDSYYGPWLQWSLSELSRDTSELSGFTHYRCNVSNYNRTVVSYPSFLSGSLWPPNITVSEWRDNANESSIINDLHERGFSTTFYGVALEDGIRQVQEAYTDDPGEVGIADIRLAADYWLLRVAPVALRHLVLDDRGAGPISRHLRGKGEDPSGDIRTLVSYRQFQKFLADERLRPAGGHYVHAYFYPPHGPHILDRYGNYVGESSYEEQLILATNMLLEFVTTLKELGKFENSLIIVQADNGSIWGAHTRYAGEPLRDFIQIDKAMSKAIREVDLGHWTGAQVEAMHLGLLLIKPPGTGEEAGDLIVNDGLTQLLDIRKYVNNLIDEGDSAYPQREKVSIHQGFRWQIRDNERVVVGTDIMSGYINHYIIQPGGEWEIRDNIPFEWE